MEEPKPTRTLSDEEANQITQHGEQHKKQSKKLWKVLLVLLVVALVVGGFWLYRSWNLQRDPNVYGQVNGQVVNTAEVNALNTPSWVASKTVVAHALLDKWFYYYVAQKNGVQASSSAIDTELKARIGDQNPPGKAYLRVLVERDLDKAAVDGLITGYKKGRFVVAHFDQNIPFGSTPTADETKQIDQDKQYATDFINTIQSDLQSGKITFDQAIAREQADPKIGQKPLSTVLQSGSFDTTQPQNPTMKALNDYNEFTAQLEKLQQGKPSAPFIVKINYTAADNPAKTDGIWLIVQIDNLKKSLASNADVYYATMKHTLNYQQYR